MSARKIWYFIIPKKTVLIVSWFGYETVSANNILKLLYVCLQEFKERHDS